MAGARRCVSARQLALLLWKNSILKRRSYLGTRIPVFFLIEIIWPVLLFVILAGLRSKFPPEDIQQSVFRAFALPSAGALPFLQSAMCDFGGQPEQNPSDMPMYPNASVNQFYSLLERGDLFRSWNDVCSDIEGQLACFTAGARLQACQQQNPIPLNCTLRDPDGFAYFLTHQLHLSSTTTSSILGAQFNQSDFDPNILGLSGEGPLDDGPFRRQALPTLPPFPSLPFFPNEGLASILDEALNGPELQLLICETQALDVVELENAETVKDDLCALNEDQFQQLADELRDQTLNNCSVESLMDQVQALQSLSQLEGLVAAQQQLADSLPSFSNDSDTFQDLEIFLCGENVTGSGLSDVLVRLTQGDDYRRAQTQAQSEGSGGGSDENLSPKILFTPNSTCVRSIIHRANRTFAVAGILVDWSHSAASCSAYLLENDTRSSIITAVDELVAANQTIPDGIPGSENISLTDLQYSLNESNPDNVWNTLQDIHDGAQRVEESLRAIDWDIFTPTDTEDELVKLAEDYEGQEKDKIIVVAGLVFEDVPEGEKSEAGPCAGLSQPKVYIRMNSTLVHDTTIFRERVWHPGPEDGRDLEGLGIWKRVYLEYGFVFIQDMVERALIEEIVNASTVNSPGRTRLAVPGAYVEQMPYPCYLLDRFTTAMLYIFPLTMIFAWLFPIAMTIRGIVREKETRLKEFMKMMGLSDAVLRTSWFLTSGMLLLTSAIFITVILKAGLILPYSNWLMILTYLMLYAVSMIAYSFLISVFFMNANLAACVGSLLYFLVFFAHSVLLPRQYMLPTAVVTLACLWAPLAYGLGASYIVQYELQQLGLQWGNVGMNSIPEDGISIQTVMVMLVVDTVLYMVLTWYIEGVWPGRYGVAKPLYFPFQPSYWLSQKTWTACKRFFHRETETLNIEEIELIGRGEMNRREEDGEEAMKMFEEEPNLPLGISISNLSKTYSSWLPWRRKEVKAVCDLSINFYEGQITAFLGHNGAGKTTTMSVLTGLFTPSAGTARVYDQDIRTHMDDIRSSLGLCPQHNILFDLLTVREHLLFYGMMRGLGYRHIADNVPGWLEKVGLSAHADKMAVHLSGGMKRKLSVLLAFVGESRTIILDEPTSGVDPFARRQIWDFLLRHRDNRTVMLSTHHMDEAEILGDRIAILSQGSLICCGSFEFLRHNYGRGHRLSLVTHTHSTHPLHPSSHLSRNSQSSQDSHQKEETDSYSPQQKEETDGDGEVVQGASPPNRTDMITRLIQDLIPSAHLEEHRGREMRFLLPLHQARPHTLTQLFSRLETLANDMGVASYGLTACSMEEIFIQLTHKEAAEAPNDTSDATVPRPSLHSTISLDDTVSLDGRRGSEVERETILDGVEEDTDSVFQLLPDDTDATNTSEGVNGACLSGPALWLTQMQALLVKRVLYTYRRLLMYSIQTLLPLVLTIFGLYIAKMLQSVPNQSALELAPSLFFAVGSLNYMFTGGCNDTQQWIYSPDFTLPPSYFPNTTNITTPPTSLPPTLQNITRLSNYTDYTDTITNFSLSTPAPSEYLSTLYRPCGISASNLDPHSCTATSSDTCSGEPDLKCHSVCGACSGNLSNFFPTDPPSCFNGSRTGTRIQNLTRECLVNETEDNEGREAAYKMLVSYLVGTKNDYIQTRYGGVSFGHVRSEVNETLDARNLVEGDDWPFLATRQAAKAWYSFKGYHALPAYVNTLSNAILRANLPESTASSYGVRTFSHPFRYSELKKLYYIVTERGSFLINPLAAIFNLGFIAASFVLFLIEERSGKTFHLQLVCGMSRVVYWITATIWDLCTYLIFIVVVVLFYMVFQDEFYSDPEVVPTILFLFVSYGVAITPWMYLLSFVFHSPATAYIVLFCLNFFSGFSLLIIDAIIVYLNGLNKETGYIIPHLLVFPFPSYCLARSLMYTSLDRPLKRVVSSYVNMPIPHPLDDLWPFVLSLWLQALVYTALLIAVQFNPNFFRRLFRRPLSVPVVTCDDENVQREENKVQEGQTKGNILTLRDLTKVYDRGSCRGKGRVAVNRLHLSMKPKECFGLLGVNGAGKTTTFRMLTGDTHSSLGDALINGKSVKSRGVVQHAVGYCPQVDALTDQLTGRQHLTLYARLRGVPRAKVAGVVKSALLQLDLMEHADKPAGHYSGGNKRRLSTAIALLAAPQLLLLDEPTSGVDPAARQFLWSLIKNVALAGQSVLLTTHSMAECEALCSRVGIMVNGSFRCLGTPQQLKSRYGDGYRLKLRVSGPLEPIQEFIRQNFPSSVLKEHHLNTLVYQLPNSALKLSEAFRDLEKGRESLEIHDYTLSQTTLDDVFIHFASQQSEEMGLCGPKEEEQKISVPLPDLVAESEGSVRQDDVIT